VSSYNIKTKALTKNIWTLN